MGGLPDQKITIRPFVESANEEAISGASHTINRKILARSEEADFNRTDLVG